MLEAAIQVCYLFLCITQNINKNYVIRNYLVFAIVVFLFCDNIKLFKQITIVSLNISSIENNTNYYLCNYT